jgi:hypothetical protein
MTVIASSLSLRKDRADWKGEPRDYDSLYDDLPGLEAACVRWHGIKLDDVKRLDPDSIPTVESALRAWERERPPPTDQKGRIADAIGRCWVDVIIAEGRPALEGGATVTLSGKSIAPKLVIEGKRKKEWAYGAAVEACVAKRLRGQKQTGDVSGTLEIEWGYPSF